MSINIHERGPGHKFAKAVHAFVEGVNDFVRESRETQGASEAIVEWDSLYTILNTTDPEHLYDHALQHARIIPNYVKANKSNERQWDRLAKLRDAR